MAFFLSKRLMALCDFMLVIRLKLKYRRHSIPVLTHMPLQSLLTGLQNYGISEESCLYLNQKGFKAFQTTLYSLFLMPKHINNWEILLVYPSL